MVLFPRIHHIRRMSSLLNTIPAATRRVPDPIRRRVIDTAQFVAVMRRQGFRLLDAKQVTPHADARIPVEDGQHMVVLVQGWKALALLNSHDKNRRARVGFGFHFEGQFLLFVVRPLQRWKPWPPVVDDLLLSSEDTMTAVLDTLTEWRPTGDTALSLIEQIIPEVYRKRLHRPRPQAVLDRCSDTLNMARLVFSIMRVIKAGNLPPVRGARNIKGLYTPETIFTAAHAVLRTTVRFAQSKGKLSSRITL